MWNFFKRYYFVAIIVLLIVGWFISPALVSVYQYASSNVIEVTVTNAWVKENKYMANVVYPNGKTVNIQVQDNPWWLTWNSSDRWALLKKNEGKTVKIRPVGLRWDWMSWFPNPVSVCDKTECK